jgi:hypothetical protein
MLCIYDLFHILLLLWHTYGCMECVYVYMCMYVCVCMCMCNVYVYVCARACVYVYMCMYVCMCVYVRVCVYICACAYVCVCIYVHVHMCVYVYMCMCVYVCMFIIENTCDIYSLLTNFISLFSLAGSGVPRNFFWEEGVVQQNQLRTEGRENGVWGW